MQFFDPTARPCLNQNKFRGQNNVSQAQHEKHWQAKTLISRIFQSIDILSITFILSQNVGICAIFLCSAEHLGKIRQEKKRKKQLNEKVFNCICFCPSISKQDCDNMIIHYIVATLTFVAKSVWFKHILFKRNGLGGLKRHRMPSPILNYDDNDKKSKSK